MKKYKVFTGTASDIEKEINFEVHPISVDIFTFENYDLDIAFINSRSGQSDWIRIPANFFYSIDISHTGFDKIKVKNHTPGLNASYQIIIWYDQL